MLSKFDTLLAVTPKTKKEQQKIDREIERIGNKLLTLINERQKSNVADYFVLDETPKRTIFDIPIEEYIDLFRLGLSDGEICSNTTLKRWKRRNNLNSKDLK